MLKITSINQILSNFNTRGLIIDLNLGQLIAFKGMLIGIFKSPGLFQQEHFGTIFFKNFTRTDIQQQIGDEVITDDEESLRFHTAINF